MPEGMKISLTQLFWVIGILLTVASGVSGGAWLLSSYAGNINLNTTRIAKGKTADFEMQNWRASHNLEFTEQVLLAQTRGRRIQKLEDRQDRQYTRILEAIKDLKK